jgi:hypothetical protein
MSTYSIENRELRDKPVFLGNLIRMGENKRGPRSLSCENELEELSKLSPLKRVSMIF